MFIERGEKFKEGIKEEELRRAFDKVKQDIFSLGSEFSSIKADILDLKTQLESINSSIDSLKSEIITQKYAFQTQQITPTDNLKTPTVGINPTDNPTVPMEARGLKSQILGTSTGNRGVPTDKPTNQQTDNPTDFSSKLNKKALNEHILEATKVLNSLDSLKREIRLKFKSITSQEMLVFSTIYELEEAAISRDLEGPSYEEIALKLHLSSSSIRDYVQKLINKGIPILKTKLNNKKVILSISNQLKELATLETIIRLREL